MKPLNSWVALGIAALIAVSVSLRIWGDGPRWLMVAEGIGYLVLAVHGFALSAENKRRRSAASEPEVGN